MRIIKSSSRLEVRDFPEGTIIGNGIALGSVLIFLIGGIFYWNPASGGRNWFLLALSVFLIFWLLVMYFSSAALVRFSVDQERFSLTRRNFRGVFRHIGLRGEIKKASISEHESDGGFSYALFLDLRSGERLELSADWRSYRPYVEKAKREINAWLNEE